MSTTQSSPTQAPQYDLSWGEALVTGDARMDATHEEFVDMLKAIKALPHEQQLEPYRAFYQHTVDHFAQEERWMLATGFTADNCHASHHATILETMRAVEEHYLQGDTEIIERMMDAMAEWFPGHANSMDRGLALHLIDVGFDSTSETVADPSRLKNVVMSGCGSVSCTD
jgi:hemerythrin